MAQAANDNHRKFLINQPVQRRKARLKKMKHKESVPGPLHHDNDNSVVQASCIVQQGDCIELMAAMPRGSVNLVVTSPPYMNAGMEYGDRFSSEEAYIEFSRRYLRAIHRVLTDNGSAWINVGAMFNSYDGSRVPLTYLLWPLVRELGFVQQQEVVWVKPGAMAHHKRFTMRSERWMWLTKRAEGHTFNLDAVRMGFSENRTRDPRNNPLGKNPGDVWEYNVLNGRSKQRTAHPCAFPVEMIERIVLACSHPGDTVLDPFGGSGTTGEAAVRHGRKAILCEMQPDYCQIIHNRLALVA